MTVHWTCHPHSHSAPDTKGHARDGIGDAFLDPGFRSSIYGEQPVQAIHLHNHHRGVHFRHAVVGNRENRSEGRLWRMVAATPGTAARVRTRRRVVTTMPPSTAVWILLNWKLNAPTSPMLPRRLPL